MSIRQGNKVIAGHINYHPDLFDHKWADHLLNDVSWLRADTFSWQDGGVYQAAYQHLEDDIDGKTLQSETIAGITIQFYLADDGHKICPASEESNVASIYSATGVAWYYIIDTANTRFKLPRTQFAFTGIRSGVGAFVEAGLPNITGSVNLTGQSNTTTPRFNSNDVASSALYNNVSIASGMYHTDSASGSGYNRIEIDASRSNSVYGNSTTVQPKATEMYLYFYVGNFTQTALENTAGITTEEMNNKVNIGHEVIEFQEPTALNNYTWYRKYADGWVEQGGIEMASAAIVTLPIAMADTKYTVQITTTWGTGNSNGTRGLCSFLKTTTSFGGQVDNNNGFWDWQVSGMAA